MWVLGGLVLVVAIIAFLASRRRDGGVDLGSVSGQWLQEHRQSQESWK
jgi:hypothetical protein